MQGTFSQTITEGKLSFEKFREEVLYDYKIACISRETSLLGRKEVLTGKAKFGIFGDGKEIAQIAMAKYFEPGDFRSGYYRDQTFMVAAKLATVQEIFAQLYADPDLIREPFSAGRQMNGHFATRFVDTNGEWLDLANRKNISSDISPTAGQMPRGLGLAFASKVFRNVETLRQYPGLSNNGNEVCFTTIGEAATSEGPFWESINAAGVLQVPLVVFVWDDGYGISVPKEYQTTKASISEALKGFKKTDGTNGLYIYKVRGWDYAGMCEVFEEGIRITRQTHTPVIFHVDELTQPQGHSTSGSHERYKPAERLEWEREWDGMKKMREWIISNELSNENELDEIQTEAKEHVKESKNLAWDQYIKPIREQVEKSCAFISNLASNLPQQAEALLKLCSELQTMHEPLRKDVLKTLNAALDVTGDSDAAFWTKDYYKDLLTENKKLYSGNLYDEGPKSALNVKEVKAIVAPDAPAVNGFEVLNKYFDALFDSNPKVVAFGEDVGHIGDVNQGFMGLQAKYGEGRIFDTGIREATIIGQGIGLAMRGLRPIAEMQYLDYLVFGFRASL